MDVSKNRGKKPQNGWFMMVQNPIKMDDLGGFSHLFLVFNTHIKIESLHIRAKG